MWKLLLLLALLFCPGVAVAEESSTTPIADAVASVTAATFTAEQAPLPANRVPKKWERWLVKGCLAFNTFGQFLDIATTIRALKRPGFRERNPFLARFADNHERLILVKAASWGGSTYAYVKASASHPRWTALASCATGALGTYAGAMNRRVVPGE